jgi:predicted RNA-binding protein
LACNFSQCRFPSDAENGERLDIRHFARRDIQKFKAFEKFINLSGLIDPEQLISQKRRIIRKEVLERKSGAGLFVTTGLAP